MNIRSEIYRIITSHKKAGASYAAPPQTWAETDLPPPEYFVAAGPPSTLPEPLTPPEKYGPKVRDFNADDLSEKIFLPPLPQVDKMDPHPPSFAVGLHSDESPAKTFTYLLHNFDPEMAFADLDDYDYDSVGAEAQIDMIMTRKFAQKQWEDGQIKTEPYKKWVRNDINAFLKFEELAEELKKRGGDDATRANDFEQLSIKYYQTLYLNRLLTDEQIEILVREGNVPRISLSPPPEFVVTPTIDSPPKQIIDYALSHLDPKKLFGPESNLSPEEAIRNIQGIRELILGATHTIPKDLLNEYIRQEILTHIAYITNRKNEVILPSENFNLVDLDYYQGQTATFFTSLNERGLLTDAQSQVLTRYCNLNLKEKEERKVAVAKARQNERAYREAQLAAESEVTNFSDSDSCPHILRKAIEKNNPTRSVESEKERRKAAHKTTQMALRLINNLFGDVDQIQLLKELDQSINTLFPVADQTQTNLTPEAISLRKNLLRLCRLVEETRFLTRNNMDSTMLLVANRFANQFSIDGYLVDSNPLRALSYSQKTLFPLVDIYRSIYRDTRLSRNQFVALATTGTIATIVATKGLSSVLPQAIDSFEKQLAGLTMEEKTRKVVNIAEKLTANAYGEVINLAVPPQIQNEVHIKVISTFDPKYKIGRPNPETAIRRTELGKPDINIFLGGTPLEGHYYYQHPVNKRVYGADFTHCVDAHSNPVFALDKGDYAGPNANKIYVNTEGNNVTEKELRPITPDEIVSKDGRIFLHQNPFLGAIEGSGKYFYRMVFKSYAGQRESTGLPILDRPEKVVFNKNHLYYRDDPNKPGNYWVYALEKILSGSELNLVGYVDTKNAEVVRDSREHADYGQYNGSGYYWTADSGAVYKTPENIETGLSYPDFIIIPPKGLRAEREHELLDGQPIYSIKPQLGQSVYVQQPLSAKEAENIGTQIKNILASDPTDKKGEARKLATEIEQKQNVPLIGVYEVHYDKFGMPIGMGSRSREDGNPEILIVHIKDAPIGDTITYTAVPPYKIQGKIIGLPPTAIENIYYPWPPQQDWQQQKPASILLKDGSSYVLISSGVYAKVVDRKPSNDFIKITGVGTQISILPLSPQEKVAILAR